MRGNAEGVPRRIRARPWSPSGAPIVDAGRGMAPVAEGFVARRVSHAEVLRARAVEETSALARAGTTTCAHDTPSPVVAFGLRDFGGSGPTGGAYLMRHRVVVRV